MSMIPTNKIEGDSAIGRNCYIGGNTNIRGCATVGHNLKVEGWLEAKNIRGAAKGLFLTLERLRDAYSEPREGWWALIGSTLPADVYVVEGGKWVATGEKCDGLTIDFTDYQSDLGDIRGELNELGEQEEQDIARLSSEIAKVKAEAITEAENSAKGYTDEKVAQEAAARVANDNELKTGLQAQVAWLETELEARMAADAELRALIEAEAQGREKALEKVKAESAEGFAGVGAEVAALGQRHDQELKALSDKHNAEMASAGERYAQELAELAEQHVTDTALLNEGVERINASKGMANGLATLGADGRLTREQLPEEVQGYATFAGILELSTDLVAYGVYYSQALKDFVIVKRIYAQEPGSDTDVLPAADGKWVSYDEFNISDKDLLIFRNSNRLYRMDDGELKEIGSTADGGSMQLGHGADEAFPGDEGAQLSSRVDDIGISSFSGILEEAEILELNGFYYSSILKKWVTVTRVIFTDPGTMTGTIHKSYKNEQGEVADIWYSYTPITLLDNIKRRIFRCGNRLYRLEGDELVMMSVDESVIDELQGADWRLEQKVNKLIDGQGALQGAFRVLSQADYDALSQEEKDEDVIYFITE